MAWDGFEEEGADGLVSVTTIYIVLFLWYIRHAEEL
jgi:hypothetical protein